MKRSIGPLVFIAAALAGCSASTTTPSRSAVSATPVAVGLSKEQAVTATTPTAQAMSSTPVSFIPLHQGASATLCQQELLCPIRIAMCGRPSFSAPFTAPVAVQPHRRTRVRHRTTPFESSSTMSRER